MSVLAPELPDAAVLDLFAGSGALGLEAVSRGARHATFVESDRRALRCLKANIAALEAGDRVTVVPRDVFAYIGTLPPAAFDIALADPPYGRGLARRLVAAFRRVAFAGLLSVEHAADEELGAPGDASERRYGDSALTFVRAESKAESQED